mmetsp:Transcript_34799/g.89044  ORF Transcript_34799/g.89044 Transcript_34799/m.89044 type:complete len:258 (-) Transcript_34799:263-1036(-)
MPAIWASSRPPPSTIRVSSSGVTKRSQSCVPRGTSPVMYSAPTMATTYASGVRFIVDITSFPPILVRSPRPAQNSSGLRTCSTTSRHITASNWRPAATSSSTVAASYCTRPATSGSAAACRRAMRMLRSVASMPVTVAPMRASDSVSRPPPQPTSATVSPSSGSGTSGSSRKWAQRFCRMKRQRMGFMECSMEKGPSGRHHSSASAPNLAVSSGSTLESKSMEPEAASLSSSCLLCRPLAGTLLPNARHPRRNSENC